MKTAARNWFIRAQGALRTGNRDGARALLEQGITEHPNEAGLNHALGKWHLDGGDAASAADWFGKASTLAPENTAFTIDCAIALSSAGRFGAALRSLRAVESAAKDSAAYCSTRAFAERGAGDLAAAAHWYDRALRIEPQRPRALQGRATVALERGEPDAVARFDATLLRDNTDPFQWYGKAQALEVEGRTAEAREIAEALVEKLPQWHDALKFLAQLRLAAGEADFTAHYADAAQRVPDDPMIRTEWAAQLHGLDHREQAAAVIAQARRDFPDNERFVLLEAIYAGDAGDHALAEKLFAQIAIDTEERWLNEARHAIRTGDYDRAGQALDRAMAHAPFGISVWAFRGILWRLTGDPRADWLHGQDGLVQLLPLRDADSVLPPVLDVLHRLHDGSAMPLGQSLRGGTQTRGRIFDRTEAQLAALHDAIRATLEDYRANLPPADPAHPLLRFRDAPWRISGSWSVRLAGGGDYHAAHIHPQGILSSALYCALPDTSGESDPQAGWLELGRPAPEMQSDLGPHRVIAPREAHLALFPSTLYHGTRPFTQGRRMTVAFDVTPEVTSSEAG
ncbi:putative 2OG-Fe(II) oxygenase [Erythrobacter sp. EC-HK427]|uniref:putative 2OG-Fe(II) oxygenase n=1 Tax=Erythrobacter sp. EC-HK427 TaxID=2038396 RepID=UPI001252E55D|nr:putative 2OG-Fe(II) oxygenase [Erythrobacter sp. EC-HK427]VVT13818.1 conserved hypothetical protein [Erythrobacter sp. EC-HK427]